jgi:hypothetical protein
MTPLVFDAEADALGAMNFLSLSLRPFRRPTFPVYAMRGCNASRLTSSSKCTTGFRASVHGAHGLKALPSIPVYACLRCPVTEDDIKFFEGNPARRYRIRELQRAGRQRQMAIVDRAGRETIFPVGESFIPHDSDVVLSSLVSSMTAAIMARWE